MASPSLTLLFFQHGRRKSRAESSGVLPSNLGWTHKIINLGDLKCWLPTDLCVSNLASLKCSLMPVFDLWKNTHGHGMLIEHLQRATLNNDTSVGYYPLDSFNKPIYEGCFLQASVVGVWSQGTHSGSPQKPHCVQESIAPDFRDLSGIRPVGYLHHSPSYLPWMWHVWCIWLHDARIFDRGKAEDSSIHCWLMVNHHISLLAGVLVAKCPPFFRWNPCDLPIFGDWNPSEAPPGNLDTAWRASTAWCQWPRPVISFPRLDGIVMGEEWDNNIGYYLMMGYHYFEWKMKYYWCWDTI